jgi:acetyltransferase-like isoleucine patch superfamily enzyme
MLQTTLSAVKRLIPTFKGYWCFGKFVNIYGNFTVVNAAKVKIGHNVAINHDVFLLGRCGISIGDNVVLSARVMVMDGGLETGGSNAAGSDHIDRPVEIGDGAWIGAGAIILPGVVIGPGAVIGAGSVVTKSVPAGEVWAGNPARPIRRTAAANPG